MIISQTVKRLRLLFNFLTNLNNLLRTGLYHRPEGQCFKPGEWINNLRVSLLGMSLSYGSLPDGPTRIDAKKTIDETVKKLESMQPITTYGSILITESYILFKADGYLKRYPSTVTLECN